MTEPTEIETAQLLDDLGYIFEAVNAGGQFGLYTDIDDNLIHCEIVAGDVAVDCSGGTIHEAVHSALLEWKTGA